MTEPTPEDTPSEASPSQELAPSPTGQPETRALATRTVNKRATPRQATSAVAVVGPEPEEGDPLLGFSPYLHAQPRSNSITPDLQRQFVATLAATGIVTQAAKSIGRSMEALYKLRAKPGAEGFAAAWDEAVDRGVQRLEDTALARAIEGVPDWRPTSDGGLMTMGQKHNENLVMFFLRNRRPERYSEHLRPGHPVYERIRREVLAEAANSCAGELGEVLARMVSGEGAASKG